MRWIKLMTDFDDDEKIVKLTEDFGFAGQARLLKIYRLIARQMDESDRCLVVYRAGFWTRQLGFRSANDCRSFLDRLATDQLLMTDLSRNDWMVKCPKLLEIRARKKPIAAKLCALEVEVDTEVEVEEKNKPGGELRAVEAKVVKNGISDNGGGEKQRGEKVRLEDDFSWNGISDEKLRHWGDSYPAIDIKRELKAASSWIEANPKNKKKNWERFLVNWFSRTQDRAPRLGGGHTTPPRPKPKPKTKYDREWEERYNELQKKKVL